MAIAVQHVSLIFVCHEFDSASIQEYVPLLGATFASTLAFDFEDATPESPLKRLPFASIARNVIHRIAFSSEPALWPFLLAPLLLRSAWHDAETQAVVFAYPGVGPEQLIAAGELLGAGCQAVLLRPDEGPSIVFALVRSLGNERMAEHWASRVERFFLDRNQEERFESLFGGPMIDYLCDRVGSLKFNRTPRRVPIYPPLDALVPLVRHAISHLLPDSPQLQDDPLDNAPVVLNAPSIQTLQDSGNLITNLMYFVWSSRPDLQVAFDLSSPAGRSYLVDWFLARAAVELNLSAEFIEPVETARLKPGSPAASAGQIDSLDELPGSTSASVGLNLIGYPRAEMGMGAQLRSCASALETTGIPFCLVEFNHGLLASNRDTRFEHLIRSDNPYPINLFHINADQMDLACEFLGRNFFRDHYNIGYWEWELSTFPDAWLSAIDLMDEIWAPSRFIQKAISAKTAKPVSWMPLAVEVSVPGQPPNFRAEFGLPPHQFLFLFPFDFSSYSTRKNYLATIEAFRRAFDRNNPNVGLVLKTLRQQHQNRAFWDLLQLVKDDPRIHVIDRILRQDEMNRLVASCDSLVSLHRSEGFGFAIAEAMYLGKPVVVTNYSGNVDFTLNDNSCLVDYQLVPVQQGEYLFPEGQLWADPNIDTAAFHMQRLAADSALRSRLGAAASSFIRQQHSPKCVGERYANRLRQILTARQLLNSSPSNPDSVPLSPASRNTGVLHSLERLY